VLPPSPPSQSHRGASGDGRGSGGGAPERWPVPGLAVLASGGSPAANWRRRGSSPAADRVLGEERVGIGRERKEK
jgi:hypothetical protein